MIKRESIDEKFEQFHQVLRAQAELYRTLLGLARKQTKKIADKNIESFIKLLEEKRSILQEIESLEFSNAPLRYLWDAQNHRADGQTRTEIRLAVEEIRSLLEELLKVEMISQQELGVVKDSVEEELRQVSTGAGAFRSYKGRYQCKVKFLNEIG
jgi:hypothetical protein